MSTRRPPGSSAGSPTSTGTYVFRVTVTDDDDGAGYADTTFIVGTDDVRATHVGPQFVSTPSVNQSTAILELRAVIQDISAVESAADSHEGNIATATVTFANRTTGAIIAENFLVELVDPADQKTGAAVFDWEVDLGSA